ncbi:MAG: DUF2017 family protein [Kineosporiaceae bacterium]
MQLSLRPLVRRGPDGGVVIRADVVAAGTIAEAVQQTRDLLRHDDAPDPDAVVDPFDAIVAELRAGDSATAPQDPVLRRLLPDAVRDDAGGAAEFRSATEPALRRRKAEAMDVVLEDLAPLRAGAETVLVRADRVPAWLRGLNDVRLALGALLDIRSDDDLMAEVDDYLDSVDVTAVGEDAETLRAYRIIIYDMLTELQARIVDAAG